MARSALLPIHLLAALRLLLRVHPIPNRSRRRRRLLCPRYSPRRAGYHPNEECPYDRHANSRGPDFVQGNLFCIVYLCDAQRLLRLCVIFLRFIPLPANCTQYIPPNTRRRSPPPQCTACRSPYTSSANRSAAPAYTPPQLPSQSSCRKPAASRPADDPRSWLSAHRRRSPASSSPASRCYKSPALFAGYSSP